MKCPHCSGPLDDALYLYIVSLALDTAKLDKPKRKRKRAGQQRIATAAAPKDKK